MKYGLNRINIKLFTQQVGFGGKGIQFHPGVEGSNFTNDMQYGQHWNID
jgi:hypothetical protein